MSKDLDIQEFELIDEDGNEVNLSNLVDQILDAVDYTKYYDKENPYVPTPFAIQMLDFIGDMYPGGLDYDTPPAHVEIFDTVANEDPQANILAARGMAKSTAIKHIIFFIAVNGYILMGREGKRKNIRFAIYVSDSIDNGVKTMKEDLESTFKNNDYLQSRLKCHFTIKEWKFKSILDNREFIMIGYGIETGIRGSRRLGTRPQIAFLDDLLSDRQGNSQAELDNVEDILSSAIEFAIEPDGLIRLFGTPFDPNDPIYKRIANKVGVSCLIPVCEKFPCSREEFRGAWEERYSYDWVSRKYSTFKKLKKFTGFTRELMLRIGAESEKTVDIANDIVWTSRSHIDLDECNRYITTDLATGLKKDGDYLFILVWAIAPNKVRYIVDGWAAVVPIDIALDKLFDFVREYNPISVGIETSGQQGAFIRWLYERMAETGVSFNIAKNVKGVAGYSADPETVGLYPVINKLQRFNNLQPLFALRRIGMVIEFLKTDWMKELLIELDGARRNELTAPHDDGIDAMSQIMAMDVLVPTKENPAIVGENVIINRRKKDIENPFNVQMFSVYDAEYEEIEPDTFLLEM